jgi:histidine triad (HIT) family protein
MTNCVFCKIVARQLPAIVVHEDERTIAFMDISQVTPGHVLIALKAHSENLYAVDQAQAGAVFGAAARLARAIQDAFRPQGLSVYQANGQVAGQTVFHFHVHLIPRYDGDGVDFALPRHNPNQEELVEHGARIRDRLV